MHHPSMLSFFLSFGQTVGCPAVEFVEDTSGYNIINHYHSDTISLGTLSKVSS